MAIFCEFTWTHSLKIQLLVNLGVLTNFVLYHDIYYKSSDFVKCQCSRSANMPQAVAWRRLINVHSRAWNVRGLLLNQNIWFVMHLTFGGQRQTIAETLKIITSLPSNSSFNYLHAIWIRISVKDVWEDKVGFIFQVSFVFNFDAGVDCFSKLKCSCCSYFGFAEKARSI